VSVPEGPLVYKYQHWNTGLRLYRLDEICLLTGIIEGIRENLEKFTKHLKLMSYNIFFDDFFMIVETTPFWIQPGLANHSISRLVDQTVPLPDWLTKLFHFQTGLANHSISRLVDKTVPFPDWLMKLVHFQTGC